MTGQQRPPGRHKIRPELWALAVPLDTLTPHPRNPNDGDQAAIAESLRTIGQYRPIVVWRRPRGELQVILAGNTTYAAAASEGWQQLARTEVVATTEAEAWRIMLQDNRSARLAYMDPAAELALLRDLDTELGLVGSGYDYPDLEHLAAELDRLAGKPLSGGCCLSRRLCGSCPQLTGQPAGDTWGQT